MGRLFAAARPDLPLREQLERRFINARFSLLLIVAFTVINLLMCVGQNGTYWLFAANIPYLLLDIGMYFGGIYRNPTETMLDSGFGIHGEGFFFAMLAIAILIVAAYFVLWLLSGTRGFPCLVAATVLFGLDTLVMVLLPILGLADIPIQFAMDLLLHAYMLYSLIDGALARRRLDTLPSDAPIYETASEE